MKDNEQKNPFMGIGKRYRNYFCIGGSIMAKVKKPFDPRVDENGYYQSAESIGPRRYTSIDKFRDRGGDAKKKPPTHTLTDSAQAIIDAAKKLTS